MLLDVFTAEHAHHSSSNPTTNGPHLSQMPLSIFTSVLRKQNPSPAPSIDRLPNAESHSTAPDAASMSAAASSLLKDLMANNPPVLSPPPSRRNSLGSNTSTEDKPKKRAHRPKTTYNFAQPPPTQTRSKLHLRPRVLLQLHQVITSQRPKPVYEVIPVSLLGARSTRRLARTFNCRDKLCPTDLLIVKAADYGNKEIEARAEDEQWGARDVIGIICPPRDEKDPASKTEICMDDGSRWEVSYMANGGYEFNHTDVHGLNLKSRWVPKAAHRRSSTMSNLSLSPISPPDEKKFSFSTISANSRRHPVIAHITRTSIDVLDTYVMPTATAPPTPGQQSATQSPIATPASIGRESFMDSPTERTTMTTEDSLRRFIVASGIWVSFSENWSPAYASSKAPAGSNLDRSPTFRPSASRAVSMSLIDSPRSSSPASTIDEKRLSFPRFLRSNTQKSLSEAGSPDLTGPMSTKTTPSSSPVLKSRSRRANSTGTVDFNPRTGSVRKRFGLGLEDQPVPETEEERQGKRSVELLRIKELAIPTTTAEVITPTQSATEAAPACAVPKVIPPPVVIPPSDGTPASSSPPSPAPDARARKTKSAYNPITTAGMWDSGVTEGPSLRSRPTSMFVMNEKRRKQDKKRARSKSKDNKHGDNSSSSSKTKQKEKRDRSCHKKGDWIKTKFVGIFRKEKH